jgi:hypothetical protein
MPDPQSEKLLHKEQKPGIGFALFLLAAGLVILAQRFGWIPPQFDWFFPVLLIAWGASELYRQYK